MRLIYFLFIVCTCSWLLYGCSGSGVEPLHAKATSADFQLTVMPETYYGDAPECEWSLDVNQEGGFITIDILVHGAEDLKACYFDLAYDATQYHPVCAEATEALGCDILELVILDEPGFAHFGAIMPKPLVSIGFSGDSAIASVVLSSDAHYRNRVVSSAPTDEYASVDLQTYETGMAWYYRNKGDYNQNGIVELTDLTQVGIHYETEQRRFQGYYWFESGQWITDGDQNGIVSLSDITIIGQNYGHSVLGGYNVYCSNSASDYPTSNADDNGPGALLLGNVSLSAGAKFFDSRPCLRFSFNFEQSPEATFYWVRPVGSDNSEGSPSCLRASLNSAHLAVEDKDAAVLEWNAAVSALGWYPYHLGDTNMDGYVTAGDISGSNQFFHNGPVVTESSLGSAQCADTNRDGFIDGKDHDWYIRRFDSVTSGFNIYASTTSDAYPIYNDSPDIIEPIATVMWGENWENYNWHDEPGGRPYQMFTIDDVTPGTYYWVRPFRFVETAVGTPSNLIQIPSSGD